MSLIVVRRTPWRARHRSVASSTRSSLASGRSGMPERGDGDVAGRAVRRCSCHIPMVFPSSAVRATVHSVYRVDDICSSVKSERGETHGHLSSWSPEPSRRRWPTGRSSRELAGWPVFLAGGGRVVSLQGSHPTVVKGLEDHSTVADRPARAREGHLRVRPADPVRSGPTRDGGRDPGAASQHQGHRLRRQAVPRLEPRTPGRGCTTPPSTRCSTGSGRSTATRRWSGSRPSSSCSTRWARCTAFAPRTCPTTSPGSTPTSATASRTSSPMSLTTPSPSSSRPCRGLSACRSPTPCGAGRSVRWAAQRRCWCSGRSRRRCGRGGASDGARCTRRPTSLSWSRSEP